MGVSIERKGDRFSVETESAEDAVLHHMVAGDGEIQAAMKNYNIDRVEVSNGSGLYEVRKEIDRELESQGRSKRFLP